MDRLTSVDAAFLTQEREGSHMHIGGIMGFEGPAPRREELLEHIESRLHLVPRYRHKLAFPRLEMGRPVWVEDPRFNIGYHVRTTALPAPGSLEQLKLLAARIFSQRLDRSKPLWEMWCVEGIQGGRFALINKAHHCLVDGVSGADITTVLFDVERDQVRPPEPDTEWMPAPEPTDADVVAEGIRDLAVTPFRVAGRVVGAVRSPGGTLAAAREAAEGVGEVAWGLLNAAPKTPLNQPIGPHRRLAWVPMELAELKAIKNALGGTVNDVFLAMMSGALARWLRSRGVRTQGLELRGCVPVSIRDEGEKGQMGNRITIMTAPLPVYADDPQERLRIVREAMRGLKDSKQALGAEVIAGLENFQPPTIFARASRLHFSTRAYNLLVTNVPGPQFPLYLLGRQLEELIPVAFLAPEQTLAVAIMSYNGKVNVSLIADYDSFPDLDELAGHVADCKAELLDAAESGRMPATTT
jgi:WS/DGAT/MGAT family acyltransferase